MTAWYDIVEPHQDIKDGDFDEAVFAADLGDVNLGNAPIEYNEPVLFFKKTFFTEGISNLLKMVSRKLTKGKGPSVIEIQTPFGGGKTHALITIYHYLKSGKKIQSMLPTELKPIKANVVSVVGTHLDPLGGNLRNDLTIRTLWGELAYQLGGNDGYDLVKANDEEMVAPGKEKLRELFQSYEPFVILFDEVLQYMTRARGVDYRDTNLGSQTFAFLQELTETIASLERGMLIVTLPSSYLEDYTEKEEESLAKLNKIFGRIESIETPVKGDEIYSIIQRRLFSGLKNESARDDVILGYFDLYQQHKDDLPNKTRDIEYKRKMELAYPFHPEVIDILYGKWGTFSSFQRTRGVLRLLANVIEDLYKKEKPIDIILPSDIGLDSPSVRQEFLKHIGSEYESIIGSDISGHDAKSMALDKENRNWKHLAERISTTIFFYSFSADKSDKGATLELIKLSVLHKDTIPSMITEVLQRLDKSLWYLNEKGGMYKLSKIPNLNRMILDKKELYNILYKEEMERILKKEIGNAFISYLWPKSSEDIPDNKEIKLVLLNPKDNIGTAQEWLEKRGNTFRTYKNTLLFALVDPTGYGAFKDEIKTYLALREIEEEINTGHEAGLVDRTAEVAQRKKRIHDDFSYNARRMYNTLFVGNETIPLGQPTVGRESLSNWYKIELESREKLIANLHYRYLVNKFMLDNNELESKIIVEQLYKDPSFVIPESPEVVRRCIQQGISEGAFGLAYSENEKMVYDSLVFESNISTSSISLDDGEVLLSKQRASEIRASMEASEDDDSEDVEAEEEEAPIVVGPEVPAGPKRYKKIMLRIENISSTKIADLSRGVLMPISREVGSFDFVMEIEIEHSEGILKATIKDKIKETISQIGATITVEKME